jgi:Type I phosphodiesterase / nucleotide pyrophosphatase
VHVSEIATARRCATLRPLRLHPGTIAPARSAFIGALLGLLCVWLLDATQQVEVPPLVQVARPEATRLVVLLVDSLSERDVDTPGAMPKLAARLKRAGLHGPVQPCADAITVPCMAAAISGNDRLSVFALGTNFAAGHSAIASSVLGQLERVGHRAGYLGERSLAKAMLGLALVEADLKSDTELIEHVSHALQQPELHLLIAHFRALDQAAHRYGDAAQEYFGVRRVIDDQVQAIIAQLAPSDHVLVMGDHGHTTRGRHAAGLDVTTYAAYFGPQFARSVRTPMVMTEHAAIWARVFGFSRRAPRWLDDYYAGRSLRPEIAPDLAPSSRLPIWALAACVLLACAACMPFLAGTPRERYRLCASFAGSVALMVGLGAVWPDLRAYVWQSHARIIVVGAASISITALLGSGLLGWLPPLARSASGDWHARYAGYLAAALVFALPTVYVIGGPGVAQSWLGLGLFGYALWFGRKGESRRSLSLALAGLLVLSLLPVKHANYVLRGFTFYTRSLPELSPYALPLLASGLLLLVLISGRLVKRERPASWLAAALGVIAAASEGVVPDLWFLLPCSLALPLLLLALRDPRLTSVSVACAIPAVWFFYDGSLKVLTPMLAVWLLYALLPRLFRESDPPLRGALLLSLLVMSFRTAMGCRIAGIDFDFFFRFLPEDADVTSQWITQTLFTTSKYLLPPTLGLLLAKADDPDVIAALHVAAALGRARLGMCLFFLAGLVVMQPAAGAAIVGDATQEAAFWVIVLALLALVALCARVEPRAATACQPGAQA